MKQNRHGPRRERTDHHAFGQRLQQNHGGNHCDTQFGPAGQARLKCCNITNTGVLPCWLAAYRRFPSVVGKCLCNEEILSQITSERTQTTDFIEYGFSHQTRHAGVTIDAQQIRT